MICYQFKLRKMLPSWLFDWQSGIVGTGARRGEIGVLVLKQPGARDEDAVVVVRWRDWVALHGTH